MNAGQKRQRQVFQVSHLARQDHNRLVYQTYHVRPDLSTARFRESAVKTVKNHHLYRSDTPDRLDAGPFLTGYEVVFIFLDITIAPI
ncbi:MAG: hypothetical protein KatS3mg104_2335 [Phycisphaerae bacterium]|nr:MAG: hypothetical protein KatS3mg104_2335 [Phycisphaerae bacterium]